MQQTTTLKPCLVIIGVNRLTNMVIEIIELENKYEIIGLIDINENKRVYNFKTNYQVYYDISKINLLNKTNPLSFGVLCIEDNHLRKVFLKQIVELVKSLQFINVVHPSVVMGKNSTIGKGNIIGEKVIINPDSTINDFCLIKGSVSIGHDNIIEDFVTINANATIGGGVIIRVCSTLGMSINIIQNILIGEDCIIKDKALVLKDTKEGAILNGIPARVVTPE
jgi:sugar O-acyltransferase (sialic acid O-acetyltransferase NeuD family)